MTHFKSQELIVREYSARYKINPKNVFYERLAARANSLQRWDWDIKNPTKDKTMLLPSTFVETETVLLRLKLTTVITKTSRIIGVI